MSPFVSVLPFSPPLISILTATICQSKEQVMSGLQLEIYCVISFTSDTTYVFLNHMQLKMDVNYIVLYLA